MTLSLSQLLANHSVMFDAHQLRTLKMILVNIPLECVKAYSLSLHSCLLAICLLSKQSIVSRCRLLFLLASHFFAWPSGVVCAVLIAVGGSVGDLAFDRAVVISKPEVSDHIPQH